MNIFRVNEALNLKRAVSKSNIPSLGGKFEHKEAITEEITKTWEQM